jgi:spore coat polysaccharide biosynthesis protein SpsF
MAGLHQKMSQSTLKIVAIIQARMSSTRLPAKVLADICGKPMLHYVVARARRACALSLLAVATSDQATDDAIVDFCQTSDVPCFRGSRDDVLDRYYHAAKYFQADVVVRLTADCPLLDPAIIDKVVETFVAGQFDYASNTQELTYPDGLDTEVFTWKTLEIAWHEARLPSEREHVSPYIIKNTGRFRIGSIKHNQNLSHIRWTVDQRQDLELVRQIYRRLGDNPNFRLDDVVNLYREHPELNSINAGIDRNEGYLKSLQLDALTIPEVKP